MDRFTHKRSVLHNLIIQNDADLARRYLKKNHKNQPKLVDSFNNIINIRETDSDNIKYGAVACLDGACLNYIFATVFEKYNHMVVNAGYQFRLENMVADLNDVLNDNAVAVLQAGKDREKVSPIIKSIVKDYVDNVLIDKVLTTVLGNKISID